uniref:Uncharacterized protein n=1 Tax=Panagrolaimus sp. PS1159 TaxID=55785 RepID=A0AC35ERL8_9BILA
MNSIQDALPSTSKSPPQIYNFKRPHRHRFSLPYQVIEFMIKNCKSAKVWKKLITSCKFFYPKHPILPVKCLNLWFGMQCDADGEIFDSSKSFPKFWVYDSFASSFSNVSIVIRNVFKFDLRFLRMRAQRLTFDEYKHLTSSGSIKEIYLESCTIQNADGTVVTIDKLVENLQLLEKFEMRGIRATFDFASLIDFLLKNKTVSFIFAYRGPISDAYKQNVANVLREIKKDLSLKYPRIEFHP